MTGGKWTCDMRASGTHDVAVIHAMLGTLMDRLGPDGEVRFGEPRRFPWVSNFWLGWLAATAALAVLNGAFNALGWFR